MEIFLAVALFLVGAIVVAKGADFFVDASSWMSDVTGISKVLVGATVVAIATSGPELFVSMFATLQGQTDMSVGNIVGSHLCNLGIGFALIAIFRPSKNSDKSYLPNSLFTLLTAALLLLFYFLGELNFVYALILVVVYIVFTFVNIKFSSQESLQNAQLQPAFDGVAATFKDENEDSLVLQDASLAISESSKQTLAAPTKTKRVKKPTNKKEIVINILKFAIGLAGIILGSKLIVDKATILAKAMGVSEMVIGLTIVAIGTSLPEIVTTIVALIKKEGDLGIGNIFGSCVFNNALIIPITVFMATTLSFNDDLLINLPLAIVLTLITIIPTVIGKKIYRLQGIAIAAIYFGYLTFLVISS